MRWAHNHKVKVRHLRPKPHTAERELWLHMHHYTKARRQLRHLLHLIALKELKRRRLEAIRAHQRFLSSPYGRIIVEANRISRLHVPYRYGGGHWTPAPAYGPWDCSSSVSRLLQAAGFGIPTLTSGSLMYAFDSGRGRYITIMANYEHTYIVIGGRAWGTSRLRPNSSPGWLPSGVQGYPFRYGFVARHPRGL